MSGMTSIDTILESVGIDRQDLTTQVNEHRRMSGDMELVLASHFPVEDLACAIEQLAGRLAEIADDVSPEIGDFHVGGMAEAVLETVQGVGNDALGIVREHLGSTAGTEAGGLILASVPIFGHPTLRCVTHTVLNHEKRSFDHTNYLVDIKTGEIAAVPQDTSAVEAAASLAQEGGSNA